MEVTKKWDGLLGRAAAYDVNGDKIGTLSTVYTDAATGYPEWVAIHTGLFGTNVSLAPLVGSRRYGDADDLQLECTKDKVKDAPNIDPHGAALSADEEARLWAHYGFRHEVVTVDEQYGYGDTYVRERVDRIYYTPSGEPVVATTQPGGPRLRRYVVTEVVRDNK